MTHEAAQSLWQIVTFIGALAVGTGTFFAWSEGRKAEREREAAVRAETAELRRESAALRRLQEITVAALQNNGVIEGVSFNDKGEATLSVKVRATAVGGAGSVGNLSVTTDDGASPKR